MRDLTLFLAAARLGSFSAAADDLGIDRSTLSKAIARLEVRVGAKLFHRNTRSITLTSAGHRLAQGAAGPLDALNGLLDGLGEHQTKGVVRLAAPLMFGLSHVAPAVHRFLETHAEVRIEVSYVDAYHDLVEEGVDVAVRGGQLEDSSLIARRLSDMSVGFWVAPGVLRSTPRHPRDLEGVPMLMHRRTAFVLQKDGESVSVRVEPRMVTRVSQARLLAAHAGLGVAPLPDFVDTTGLEPVLPDWSFPVRPAFHLLRPAGSPSPAARALWDHLLDALGD